MVVSVELKPREVREVRRLAEKRYESVEEVDESRVEGWGHDPEYRHYLGLLGEWAFAKYYDLQVDPESYPRSDQGEDFRIRIETKEFGNEVISVDVKSSPADDPELIVKEGEVNASYYVLCRFPHGVREGNPRTVVEIVGGATKEMVLNREPRKSANYGHYNHHVHPKYLSELPPADAVEGVDEEFR